MDTDEEARRMKWLLTAGLVFLVSAYFAVSELKYAIWGNTTEARVVRVYDAIDATSRGSGRNKVVVQYEFTDTDGTVRKESDAIPASEPRPEGPTVQIQYRSASPDASRLSGHSQRLWLLVFFGSLGFAGFKIWGIVKESKR